MIISASRRTDIPAFFMRWFLNRLEKGVVATQNPFNPKQIREITLTKDSVEVIAFWTRDARNLLLNIDEIEKAGIPFFVHYTITGYPRILEPHLPSLEAALTIFRALSDRIGASRVIWRYDPVFVSSATPIERHKEIFSFIAKQLQNKTQRVVLSYMDFYAKTRKQLKLIDGLCFSDDEETIRKYMREDGLASFFARTASDCGMKCVACAEPLFAGIDGITPGACLDAAYLEQEFGHLSSLRKDRNQRPACACVQSVDIGAYHSCSFGCTYCYATQNRETAMRNRKRHQSESLLILNGPEKE